MIALATPLWRFMKCATTACDNQCRMGRPASGPSFFAWVTVVAGFPFITGEHTSAV